MILLAWIVTAFFGSIIDSMVGRSKEDYPKQWMKTYQDFYWLTVYCLIITLMWSFVKQFTGMGDEEYIIKFIGTGLTLGGVVWDSFYSWWNSGNMFARAKTWLNFPFWHIDFKDMKLAHAIRLCLLPVVIMFQMWWITAFIQWYQFFTIY